MRLFLGIPVPPRIAQTLLHHARSLKLGAESPRWTAPENLHLTLVFLGEAAAEKLAAIAGELETLSVPQLKLRIAGLGAFPRAGVVFAEIERAPALMALQTELGKRMDRIGFAVEDRAYHPHLTIARLRRPARLKPAQLALPSTIPSSFTANEVILYRSVPSPAGSRYEPLMRRASAGG